MHCISINHTIILLLMFLIQIFEFLIFLISVVEVQLFPLFMWNEVESLYIINKIISKFNNWIFVLQGKDPLWGFGEYLPYHRGCWIFGGDHGREVTRLCGIICNRVNGFINIFNLVLTLLLVFVLVEVAFFQEVYQFLINLHNLFDLSKLRKYTVEIV